MPSMTLMLRLMSRANLGSGAGVGQRWKDPTVGFRVGESRDQTFGSGHGRTAQGEPPRTAREKRFLFSALEAVLCVVLLYSFDLMQTLLAFP
jgi:hypothetical protein